MIRTNHNDNKILIKNINYTTKNIFNMRLLAIYYFNEIYLNPNFLRTTNIYRSLGMSQSDKKKFRFHNSTFDIVNYTDVSNNVGGYRP